MCLEIQTLNVLTFKIQNMTMHSW